MKCTSKSKYSVSICLRTQGAVVKNLPANAGHLGLIPGWGRFPGRGNGNPLQYFCLENPVDSGACQATVHRIEKNRAWLSTHKCIVGKINYETPARLSKSNPWAQDKTQKPVVQQAPRVVLPAPKIYKQWLDQGVTEWFWIKQTMLGILAPPFQGGNWIGP